MRIGHSVVAALMAVLLVAVAVPVSAASEKIVFQYRNEPDVVQAWIAGFNELHPSISVEWEPRPAGDWEAQNIVRMAAGTGPDVLEFWGAYGQDLARRGFLLDLGPYVQRDFTAEDITDFYPPAWRSSFTSFGPKKGSQFAMPRYINMMVFYYNIDLLQRAGLETPRQLDARGQWTWNTLREYGRKLTIGEPGNIKQWGIIISTGSMPRMLNWVWGAGGDFFHPDDPTKFVGHEPEAVAGIQFLHDLIWQDGTMPATDSSTPFRNGTAALHENGLAEIPTWMNSVTGFNWDVIRKPAGPAGRPGYLVDDSFGIWSESKNPQAAWMLLRFLVSRRGQEILVKYNRLPPVRGSASRAYLNTEPSRNLQAFPDAVAEGRPSIVTRIAGDVAQVSTELTNMLRSVLRTNAQSYATASQEIRPRINKIIADSTK